MAPLGIAFRWIASVPLFALCGLIGLTIGSTALQAMGASLPYSNMAGMICATICGALTGILTAPPQHRRLGTYLFAGAPIIWMSYSAVAHYLSGDIAVREHLALLGTIVGGVVIYAATGRAYPNRNRVDDRHAETTRMIIRWVVATLLSVLGFSLTLILAVLSTHWFDSGHLEIFGGAYFSTSVGVMIGIQTVPPRHRALGFWVFATAALLFIGITTIHGAVSGRLSTEDIFDLAGAVLGCVSVWRLSRDLRKIPEPNSTNTAPQSP